MSTDDPLSALQARRRRALPADPSEDELARHWSLTPADLAEVGRCRGDDHRRRFALQLCMMRAYGRFLDDYRAAPLPIVNYLSRQLGLAPVLFLDQPGREPTEREQAQRIRRYLGVRDFDSAAETDLREWLRQGVVEGRGVAELLLRAEERLRSRQIMLPGASTLDRIVHSEAAHATAGLFANVAEKLSEKLRAAIALLLEVPEGDSRSSLFRLKRYPTIGTPPAIKADLARLRLIDDLLGDMATLEGIDSHIVRQLGELGRRYDAGDLRRFPAPKREALVVCYLIEARKTLLDQLVDMHDQFLTTMTRRSRLAVEDRHRKLRRRARDGLHRVLGAIDALHAADGNQTISDFRTAVDAPRLLEAAATWREYERLEERGQLDALLARYSLLRQYLPGFLSLPFEAAAGSEALLRAIEIARALDAGERTLAPDDPAHFVPAAWRPFLIEDGKVERRIWEIALAFAAREALRAGNLFLSRSRSHVSFWNLIHDERSWREHRDEAYRKLNLPTDARSFLERIAAALDRAARAAAAGLERNRFAKIENGRVKLKQRDAMPVPRELHRLRDTIRTSMPRVRIEDLLQDVDEWCGFTRAFQPLGGYASRPGHNAHRALLATLIAHGTNLGLAAMSQSTDCLTAGVLQDTSRWFLREATLKTANAILVDYHHRLPISQLWGDGSRSSSDGQRFAIEGESLLGAFYPRYFGYYQRVLTVYTHTSDQSSVYATQVISCAPREALFVLNGILDNETALGIRQHTSDTHGATDQLFGICALLGIEFMPRLKDLPDQVLYRVDRDADYGALNPVLRGVIDVDLIAEQWDQLVRIVASLRDRTAPADVVLQRLINAAPADRLAKALTALGSLIKTIHILRYIHEAPLRQAIQLQLNRGEFRHILAKWLFFANQGDFRTGDYEEIMNKASCLSLLSNAVLVWNTVHIARIVAQLRAGGHEVKDEDLARVSPLLHAHTVPSGSYFQSPRRRSDLMPQPVSA